MKSVTYFKTFIRNRTYMNFDDFKCLSAIFQRVTLGRQWWPIQAPTIEERRKWRL